MHLMTDFKFDCSLNDLICDFVANVLNFIVCANKKAILPQFQDEMIRFPSSLNNILFKYMVQALQTIKHV